MPPPPPPPQVQREIRLEQQRAAAAAAAAAAEAAGGPAARPKAGGGGSGRLSLAERAQKYAPNVYKGLAGHDWAGADAGDGLRRRGGGAASGAVDGPVGVLEGVAEWRAARAASRAGGRALVVVYYVEPADERTREALRAAEAAAAAAAAAGGATVARMEVGQWLGALAQVGGRRGGRGVFLDAERTFSPRLSVNCVKRRDERAPCACARNPPVDGRSCGVRTRRMGTPVDRRAGGGAGAMAPAGVSLLIPYLIRSCTCARGSGCGSGWVGMGEYWLVGGWVGAGGHRRG
jgi:hypothetical protein